MKLLILFQAGEFSSGSMMNERKLLRESLHCRLPSLIISEAKGRKEAMEIIRISLPDLIFIDIRLPDGNGLEVTHQIKKLHPDVKVVTVSSYDEPEYRDAAFRCKADHYVAKDNLMSLFSGILSETLSG